MRFLLDESSDRRLAEHLAILGHDVVVVGLDHPPSPTDVEVLSIAHREGRILLTDDRDFGELVFDRLHPHAGVILMRVASAPLATKISRLDHVLSDYAAALGRFIVVTERHVRVR